MKIVSGICALALVLCVSGCGGGAGGAGGAGGTSSAGGASAKTTGGDTGGAPSAPQNPYKKATVGQWTEYRTVSDSAGTKSESKSKTTVAAKDDKSITLKTVVEVAGTKMPEQTNVIKFDEPVKTPEYKTEELEKGSETLAVAGKSFACHWVKSKTVIDNAQMKSTTLSKDWLCDDVPLGGVVKSESTSTMVMNGTEIKTVMTMELVGTGQ
ncbi:MAG: hypothetical protein HY291_04830 [Planctomycetes bacterium]|nr:hypothetical protein [Planctomycetota bacterium]